jgi:predicted DNA-binding transcriptional regulator AlpA
MIQKQSRMVNIPTAGEILGISRATAFSLARRDALPVPVFRIGGQLRVSREALDELISRRKTVTNEKVRDEPA